MRMLSDLLSRISASSVLSNVGAYAAHEEAEQRADEVLKLHDHPYAGELADRTFITPPADQGDLYELKLQRD